MNNTAKTPLVEKRYLVTFIIVTSLFALWGFANDITNPLVAAFQTLMEISAAKASMIQFAFYGGYATMALPAALFIRRYSYKTGLLIGLGLYALGAFLFIPAAAYEQFSFFCLSLYILTFGLAFLETTANPFILTLGAKESATRRLNLAQSFNPVGSLTGMAVASLIILPNLISDRRGDAGELLYPAMDAAGKASVRVHDLAVIRDPYVAIGVVVLVMAVIIAFTRMPVTERAGHHISVRESISRLRLNRNYCLGVLAQMFYVAAQIMVWTFIIQYAENVGMTKATAQNYNILAMIGFLCFRFIGTFCMKYFRPAAILTLFGIGATLCSLGAVLIVGMGGLWCLVCISSFMSIMFPSIYGIALDDVNPRDTPIGSAFLVMSIVGGALMPPIQGAVIDMGTIWGMPAVNISYLIPLACFIIVTLYGLTSLRRS